MFALKLRKWSREKSAKLSSRSKYKPKDILVQCDPALFSRLVFLMQLHSLNKVLGKKNVILWTRQHGSVEAVQAWASDGLKAQLHHLAELGEMTELLSPSVSSCVRICRLYVKCLSKCWPFLALGRTLYDLHIRLPRDPRWHWGDQWQNTSAEGSNHWKQEMAIRLGGLGSLDSPSLSTLCLFIFCFLCNQTQWVA